MKHQMPWGMAVLVTAASAFGLAGVAASGTAAASPGDCLWAGTAHAQGSTVVAGGWTFNCGTGPSGAPRWSRGAAVGTASTVANPGAITNPAGLFSAGAIQPGTEYNDYCVGSQLIDGNEAMYEAVSDGGQLFWKAAGPISRWTFDAGTGPAPRLQPAQVCDPGPTLWPDNPSPWPETR